MDQRPYPSSRSPFRALVLVVTLIASVLWITVKHPFEGPTIYQVTTYHGIHRWDFLAVIPSLGALFWWLQPR